MAIQWQPVPLTADPWGGSYVNETGGLEWQTATDGYVNEQTASGTTVTVTAGVITYGGQVVTVSAATVLAVTAGTITYVGQAIQVLAALAVIAGTISYTGMMIIINQLVQEGGPAILRVVLRSILSPMLKKIDDE